uniref:Uncharacterized protein n=2 Tax=Aegilops tauschii subsp. strangulata TaxID=200361 RepID=A0A452XGD8_AEGTS
MPPCAAHTHRTRLGVVILCHGVSSISSLNRGTASSSMAMNTLSPRRPRCSPPPPAASSSAAAKREIPPLSRLSTLSGGPPRKIYLKETLECHLTKQLLKRRRLHMSQHPRIN